MLLVINSNNTNTVFAVFDGETRRGSWRISTQPHRTADEYMVWLTQLMALEGLERNHITGTILSNVVPQASFNLRSLCQRYFGGEPLVVGDPALQYGLKVLIDRPEEAGADRIANAVAAKLRYAMPAVVVDLGTATTFDVLDRVINELATPDRGDVAVAQTVHDGLRDIDAVNNHLLVWRARTGETLNQADSLELRISESKLGAQVERSNAEDLDMVQAISNFQNQQTGYDAALRAYSVVQRMSLFNYISG